MRDELDRIVIYPSRLKLTAALVGALLLVGLGIVFACYRQEMRIRVWSVLIASYVGVPFFGACACYALYRLIFRRPALVIDDDGIVDRASALGVGFISWDEIEKIAPYTFLGQIMLGIVPKDLSTVLARQLWLKRGLIRINLRLGCAPINIPQVGLPITVDELVERIMLRFGTKIHGDA